MKGLLYKDLINGKAYIGLVVFYLFYAFMTVETIGWEFVSAVGLEAKLGVLSGNYILLMSTVFVACLIPMSMSTVLCTLDNKTKWTSYATALPGGYKNVVAEKYIIVVIGHVIGVLASLITIFAIKHTFEVEVDGVMIEDVGANVFIVLMLLMLGISLIGNSILIPFVSRNKPGVVNITLTVCAIIVMYGLVAYIALGDISFFKQGNIMERMIMWVATHKKEVWGVCYGLVGVGLVSEIVSYVVSVKNYLKYV
ncbi:MAG: ABC-2 transporter permease [Lachnospiraceae bacterium]|nr:ABC-2 transporter permease [Lachnospiraceae bacterium]